MSTAVLRGRLDRLVKDVVRFAHNDQRAAESERPKVIAIAPACDDVDRRMTVGLLPATGWTIGPTLRIDAAELGEVIAERHAYHEAGRGSPTHEISTDDDYFFWMPVPDDIAVGLLTKLQSI